MDAYEHCVAHYGLEGATLERIAKQAGLARPLIRHNVGNRQELIRGLMQRFEQRCAEFVEQLDACIPAEFSASELTEPLFQRDCSTVRVAYALGAAVSEQSDIETLIEGWLTTLKQFLAVRLKRRYPQASAACINAVAVGVGAIYSNWQAYRALGNNDDFYQHSQQAAVRLVQSLEAGK